MFFQVLLWLALLAPSEQAEILQVQQAIQSGNLDQAESLLTSALSNHPQDAGLLNLRGIVHAQRQQMTAARQDFSAALRLSPALTPAWQNLARVCQMESDLPCATNAWQHVTQAKPADQEAHQSLAVLYNQTARYSESLAESQKLTAPEHADLFIRVLDLCALNRYREATTLATRTNFPFADWPNGPSPLDAQQADPVVIALSKHMEDAPVRPLQRVVLAYENLRRPADARKVLERIALLDPQNPAHLLELARIAEMSKDHESALGYLAHARELAPNNPQIHFLWGVIASEMDLPIEARHSLDKALALEPNNPSYNYAMGSVILSTRDAATASSYFEKFVNAKPAEPRGHLALGIAYFASGDYEKAKAEMQSVAADARTAAQAEYFLGRIERLDGNLTAAIEHLHKSIKQMPSYPESHTELGRVHLLQGEIEPARAELTEALKLDPRSFQANDQLLVLYKRTKDPRAAQQSEIIKQLDEERSRRADLMLRTIEAKPY